MGASQFLKLPGRVKNKNTNIDPRFSPQDKVRTESYRDFMYSNPEVFRDKVSRMHTVSNVCITCSICRVAGLIYIQVY